MNVYDFDNTIYDGESAIDFFVYFLKKDLSLLKYVPSVIKALFAYKARKITIDVALERYASLVEDYCRNIDDFQAETEKFWDKHMHKIKPFYSQIRKDDDVILSAGFDIVLEEIGRRLGIKNIVATTIDRQNFKIVDFCFRENKVKAFKSRYPDAVIENFYTDSLNDQPIIDIAQNAFLVKGNKIKKIK